MCIANHGGGDFCQSEMERAKKEGRDSSQAGSKRHIQAVVVVPADDATRCTRLLPAPLSIRNVVTIAQLREKQKKKIRARLKD